MEDTPRVERVSIKDFRTGGRGTARITEIGEGEYLKGWVGGGVG